MESFNTRSPSFTTPALLIGLSILASAFVITGTIVKIDSLTNTIDVTGIATRTVTATQATWTTNITRDVTANGLAQGSTDAQNDLTALINDLKEQGIAENAIVADPIVVTAQRICGSTVGNSCQNPRIIGYQLTRSIRITSDDVSKVERIAQGASTALLEKGVFLDHQELRYAFPDLTDIKTDLIAEASKNAKGQASAIADHSSIKLGTLRKSEVQVIEPTGEGSGLTNTTSSTIRVTLRLHASYGVE